MAKRGIIRRIAERLVKKTTTVLTPIVPKLGEKSVTQTEVPPEKAPSVTNIDYSGGGSKTIYTSEDKSGNITTTEVATRTEEGFVPPTTTTIVRNPRGEILSRETKVPRSTTVDFKTQMELRNFAEKQQQYYQGLVNKGYDVNKATEELNKTIREYQKGLYEQQGYRVTEQDGQFLLEREIPREEPNERKPIIQPQKEKIKAIDIFTGMWIPKIGENIKNANLKQKLGEKISQTEFAQKSMEKYPFLKKGITIGKKTISWGTINAYFENIGKGIFFSPAMSTGTAQTLEQKQISKQISKTRFDKLNKVKAQLEKNVANKKTGEEQIKYLVDLYKKYVVTDEQKAGFKIFLQELQDKQILKPIIRITPMGRTSVPTIIPKPVSSTVQNEVLINIETLSPMGNIKGAGTILGVSSTKKQSQKQEEVQPQKNELLTISPTILGLIPLGKMKQNQMQSQTFGQTQVQSQAVGQIQPQISSQTQIQKEIALQMGISLSALKQTQLQKQFQLQKQSQKQTQVQKSILKLTQPQIFLKKSQLFSLSKPLSVKTTSDIFKTYYRRKKKDIFIGKFEGLETAKQKLIKSLKSTLGASGFVTKNEKKIPFKELKLGFEFTPSKKDLFRVVQKREFRLGTRSEVQEILSSRKTKGRKIKWL